MAKRKSRKVTKKPNFGVVEALIFMVVFIVLFILTGFWIALIVTLVIILLFANGLIRLPVKSRS